MENGGKYGLLQVAKSENEIKDESLRFILKDDTIFDFDIIDKDNQILLLKK
ncbi:hypothetical protein [uncultured Draconibacterium sp.]|uniref:hypothetical protein n=1 Tax=uncultured Draconibacterium sp. TaxID=1573823 RepID=UPI0029C8574F|nr:hypothetical protein [uncultured Draconibacterium sp.]